MTFERGQLVKVRGHVGVHRVQLVVREDGRPDRLVVKRIAPARKNPAREQLVLASQARKMR